MDIASLTISTALEQLRAGTFTGAELTDACFQAIERLNPEINAFITIFRPERSETRLKGELSGIPLAVKDLYEAVGAPTTCGTTFFKDYLPANDSAVVEKLKAAGAFIVGKTHTHEIALGVTGVNPHYGTVRNPWDVTRITGGSSSGSAAAVAAGMCLAAIGTDTGGSIRIPASLCGVVGLKPTSGRVSLRGVFPLSWNLDHAGPLTKTVKDAALLLHVIAGYDERDSASANIPVGDYLSGIEGGVKGWRIAVLTGDYAWGADPEVLEAVHVAAHVFESLGAQVEPVEMNFLREAALANGLMTLADGAAFHRERLAEHPLGFGEDVRLRLQTGAALTAMEYSIARRTQTEMRRRMETFFAEYDLLLTPATPIPAPLIEGNDALELVRRLTRFTAPFNLAGLPALSVPCGFTPAGLPIGLQIVSAAWGEEEVLQAGHAFEQATDWHKRKPVIRFQGEGRTGQEAAQSGGAGEGKIVPFSVP
jgi:aspartyl-tRNA(Asn)/glutamyl-tRNA(Gln) amidotransferase subunit A